MDHESHRGAMGEPVSEVGCCGMEALSGFATGPQFFGIGLGVMSASVNPSDHLIASSHIV